MVGLQTSKVHRLGQDREVFVKRLVITNTVEDRILCMQETKVRSGLKGQRSGSYVLRNSIQKSLADGSLGEGSGQKMGRLSVKQLANRVSFSFPFITHTDMALIVFGLDHRGNLL